MATGGNFSLALVSDGTGDGVGNDGTVWAWGDNFRGQLGNASPGSSNVPVQVHGVGDVGFLTDVVAVAAGSSHSLAVKSDGTVYAWGYNGFGQLGNGTSLPGTQSNVPVQVQGVGGAGFLTGVSSVAGGGLHSLALKSDGTVYAWGYNGTGGLGNDGGPDSSTPVQVKDVGGIGFLGGVTSVAAGSEHSLALKGAGTLWAWGNNFKGQVGDNGPLTQRNTPVQVRDESGSGFLTGVTDVAAGAEHSLAAVSPHGTVWAWGRNEFGSLGNGSFGGNFSRPVQAIQLIGATEVAAGDFHSLAVADADTTSPTTTATPSSAPNAAGWNTSDVTVNVSADDGGGSGVKEIVYSASGAQTIPSTTDPGDTVSIPITSEGQTTITYSATDEAGNAETPVKSLTIMLDKTVPTVSSVTPLNGRTGVRRDANLTSTFSEKMNKATLTKSTFKLFKVNADGSMTQINNVAVTPTPNGLRATLDPYPADPSRLLARNTRYKAVVTTGARDPAGNRLDQNPTRTGSQSKVWTFTTGG